MKFTIYRGEDEDYYWRAKARNGRIIADGSEGYSTRGKARRALNRFIGLTKIGDFEIINE